MHHDTYINVNAELVSRTARRASSGHWDTRAAHSTMALRKIADGAPLDAAAKLAITEHEKLERQRDAEARAAFEATFKRANGKGAPATLPAIQPRLRRHPGELEDEDEDEDVKDATPEVLGPPGVPMAQKCTATGAGVGGGTAKSSSHFIVVAKDGGEKRVSSGGGDVRFVVRHVRDDRVCVEGQGKDWNDGTYGCSYSVEGRGDYAVEVTFNGEAIHGSPFPVFFAAAIDTPLMPPGMEQRFIARNDRATLGMCRDFILGKCDRVICKFRHEKPPPPPPSLGPEVPQELKRTAHVSNLPNAMTLEQVKQVFSFCGTITDAREGGTGKNFAFLEFSTNEEVVAALALNGMNIGGRNIRVELAKTPKLINPSVTKLVVTDAPKVDAAHAAAKVAGSEAVARAAEISRRLAGAGGVMGKVPPPPPKRHKPY